MKLIFDSHAHYDDTKFDDDRDELLTSMLSNNVNTIINCGVDIDNSKKCIDLSKKYERIYCALGIHPNEVDSVPNNYIVELEKMFEFKKAVAIGEIGLDYHYDFSKKESQIKVFEEQILLSKNLNKPIIVHNREAHKDTLELLNKYIPQGVIHCFSGSPEMAEEIIKIGMYIGIGGAVTFKNAKKIIDVVKYTPIDRILLETDAPYMTPVPYRGQRCDSNHILTTAKKISEIKNISLNDVLNISTENACNLFSINLLSHTYLKVNYMLTLPIGVPITVNSV